MVPHWLKPTGPWLCQNPVRNYNPAIVSDHLIVDMNTILMQIRGLPNGHNFSDFELAEYITELMADYYDGLSELSADNALFHIENKLRILYKYYYPDMDWLKVVAGTTRLKKYSSMLCLG
jgi:hypothetical protein